ncbi:hypothetical protein [Streptomyces longwoodensis]|uniref:hypothetical protein n=1 Tax=Streptomyces longwoodensis TaxID=68231 RepID=UPI0036E3509F
MSTEERRAFIRRLAYGAPPLAAEDADQVRALLPLQARVRSECTAGESRWQGHRGAA